MYHSPPCPFTCLCQGCELATSSFHPPPSHVSAFAFRRHQPRSSSTWNARLGVGGGREGDTQSSTPLHSHPSSLNFKTLWRIPQFWQGFLGTKIGGRDGGRRAKSRRQIFARMKSRQKKVSTQKQVSCYCFANMLLAEKYEYLLTEGPNKIFLPFQVQPIRAFRQLIRREKASWCCPQARHIRITMSPYSHLLQSRHHHTFVSVLASFSTWPCA